MIIVIIIITINDRTESAVFSVPPRLTDARSVVAVPVWTGRTSWITGSLSTRRTRPAFITLTPLTWAPAVGAAVHRAQLWTHARY